MYRVDGVSAGNMHSTFSFIVPDTVAQSGVRYGLLLPMVDGCAFLASFNTM